MILIRLLADTGREPASPGAAALRLETTPWRTGRSTAPGGLGHATSAANCPCRSAR